jgi:hypothetical protein
MPEERASKRYKPSADEVVNPYLADNEGDSDNFHTWSAPKKKLGFEKSSANGLQDAPLTNFVRHQTTAEQALKAEVCFDCSENAN